MRRRLIGLAVVLALAWGGLGLLAGVGLTADDGTVTTGPKLGLDLQGGTSVVLTAPDGTEEDVLVKAVEIMRTRIEAIGSVQEPEIQISGNNTVLVQLPGVEDERRALDAIGQTGQLSFRPVLGATFGEYGPLGSLYVDPAATTTTLPEVTTTVGEGETTTTVGGESTTTTAVEDTTTTTLAEEAPRPPGLDPETGLTITDLPGQEAYLRYDGFFGPQVLHVGPSDLLGSDVAQAIPGFDTQQSQWVVSLDLTSSGGDKFAQLTGDAAGFPTNDPRRQIAIVLDGNVISAPEVNPSVAAGIGITGGRAQITLGAGPEDEAQARDLAITLRYGSLPVSFERSQVQKVSATLGADSLQLGLVAGMAGLALVALALVLYYRSLGLVAIIGLTIFGSLLVSLFILLGHYRGLTLTLAGVTGVIVSIGITADSYIVYFERIKDELRAGKTIASAVSDGFTAAYRTILTADFVSLLAAGLLWILAVGPVKGFALSLGIATILDLLIAPHYTRHAAWLLAHTRFGDGGRFSIVGAAGLAKETA